jgi:molybdenum cofactor cytidylyltransferase
MLVGVGGIILAAGESSRMGRDKALLTWPPSSQPLKTATAANTLLSATIDALGDYCDMVIVVAGKNEAMLEPIVYSQAAYLVVNRNPERGQFSSLQIGLREVLSRGRDSAMITLVDRPPAQSATLQTLLAAFEGRARRWAVVPEYQGKHGHPIVIGKEMMDLFLKAPATANAREIEHGNHERIEYVPVDDSRVVMNINTPEDYAALAASLGR